MLEAMRSGAAVELGFASTYDYAESVLEMGAREVYERVRVAEALETLPLLRDALVTRNCCFSAVRELTRVCVPETEAAWLAAARGQSVRMVEALVSGHVPGDLPGDPVDVEQVRRNLVYEVTPATHAMAKDLRRRIEAEVGHRLDDDAFIAEVVRAALATGPRNPGSPSYQIAVTVCERCEAATQDHAGQVVPIDTAVLDQAMCDCHRVDLGKDGLRTRDVPAPTRRAVLARDHHRCRTPGCRSSRYVDIHHLVSRSRRGSHNKSNLIVMCGAHHGAFHHGLLVIRGTTTSTVSFHHPDGAPFGQPRVTHVGEWTSPSA